MHQQECDVAPTSLSVAPCSDRSTRGLATPKQEARSARFEDAMTQAGSPDPRNDRICITPSCPRQFL